MKWCLLKMCPYVLSCCFWGAWSGLCLYKCLRSDCGEQNLMLIFFFFFSFSCWVRKLWQSLYPNIALLWNSVRQDPTKEASMIPTEWQWLMSVRHMNTMDTFTWDPSALPIFADLISNMFNCPSMMKSQCPVQLQRCKGSMCSRQCVTKDKKWHSLLRCSSTVAIGKRTACCACPLSWLTAHALELACIIGHIWGLWWGIFIQFFVPPRKSIHFPVPSLVWSHLKQRPSRCL